MMVCAICCEACVLYQLQSVSVPLSEWHLDCSCLDSTVVYSPMEPCTSFDNHSDPFRCWAQESKSSWGGPLPEAGSHTKPFYAETCV